MKAQLDVYQYSKLHSVNPVKRWLAKGDNRFHFAIASYKEHAVYITGGYLDGCITGTVLCFSLETYQFNEVRPICNPRRSHASVTVGSSLFVIGGTNGIDTDLSIE